MSEAAAAHAVVEPQESPLTPENWGKLGMWLFLAGDAMSFGCLIVGYGILRHSSTNWPVPAQVLGIDPAELRLAMVTKPDSLTASWLRVGSTGLAECIRTVVDMSGWKERRGKLGPNRGLGMACSHYISGASKPKHWTGEPHAPGEVHGSLSKRNEPRSGRETHGWECTIAVQDLAAIAAAIAAHGGKILLEEYEIVGVGRLIQFADPDGNVACAMQYEARG